MHLANPCPTSSVKYSWWGNGRTTTLGYKKYLFFSESKALWWVRDRWTERDEDRLPYWPITSLSHTTLGYLQDPTKHFFGFSAGEYITGGSLWATVPARRSPWLQAETPRFATDCRLTLTPNNRDPHVGIIL